MKTALGLCILALSGLFAVSAKANTHSVAVDFSLRDGAPLVKTKFHVYQTPLAGIERLERDMPLLKELGVYGLRYESGWGKRAAFNHDTQFTGTPLDLSYNKEEYERFLELVADNGADLLITHSYTPDPLKPAGDWRDKPTSLLAWRKINKDWAGAWHAKGIARLAFEVWNEPDYGSFATFSLSDYLDLYYHAAKGIAQGAPHAKIGGPAIAFPESSQWYRQLLDLVREYGLPFHFLSGHAYSQRTAREQIAGMNAALGKDEWPTVEMYLTEYASYSTSAALGHTREGGKIERYVAAADFLQDVQMFLEHTELTRVYWAQWMDVEFIDDEGNWFSRPNSDKMGFVDITGHKKAIYNAFKIYNMLPVDRYRVAVDQEGVNALAGRDSTAAGVVAWNEDETDTNIRLNLRNLPFDRGTARVYRIDAEHSSFHENPENEDLAMVESFPITSSDVTWGGSLPGKGVVYLSLDDGSGEEPADAKPIAGVVKTHHWYRDRGNSHYADFDHKNWIARLGMGADKEEADAMVGVTIADLPPKLGVRLTTGGVLKDIDENSTLGMRVDYQDASGEFRKSVQFHNGIHHDNQESEFPWGTKRAPDRVVRIEDAENFELDLAKYAPERPGDRAIVTFRMRNTGRNTLANFHLMRTEAESGDETSYY